MNELDFMEAVFALKIQIGYCFFVFVFRIFFLNISNFFLTLILRDQFLFSALFPSRREKHCRTRSDK